MLSKGVGITCTWSKRRQAWQHCVPASDLSVSQSTTTSSPKFSLLRRSAARSVNTFRLAAQQSLQRGRQALSSVSDDADPGHWEYSPEWWGTHAGGWGRDAGQTLFAQHSLFGNGEVNLLVQAIMFGPIGSSHVTFVACRSPSPRTVPPPVTA